MIINPNKTDFISIRCLPTVNINTHEVYLYASEQNIKAFFDELEDLTNDGYFTGQYEEIKAVCSDNKTAYFSSVDSLKMLWAIAKKHDVTFLIVPEYINELNNEHTIPSKKIKEKR